MIIPVIHRFKQILDEEVKAIEQNDFSRLGDISNRKNQAHLELSRLYRSANGAFDSDTVDELQKLHAVAEENMKFVGIRLQAYNEIAQMLADAASRADSDGTYTAPASAAGGSYR